MRNRLKRNEVQTGTLTATLAGEACAICERAPTLQRLALDHCHATGRLRGLLCIRCNTALGSFGDRIDLLERAIAYLRDPPAYRLDSKRPRRLAHLLPRP